MPLGVNVCLLPSNWLALYPECISASHLVFLGYDWPIWPGIAVTQDELCHVHSLGKIFVGATNCYPLTSLFLLQISVDYIEIANEGMRHIMDGVMWILVCLLRQLSRLNIVVSHHSTCSSHQFCLWIKVNCWPLKTYHHIYWFLYAPFVIQVLT